MVGNFATVTLASFGNRRAPSRLGNGITGMGDRLAASCDEAKQNRQPEPGHSLIESARSSRGAGCRDEDTPGTEPREKFSP